VARSISGSERIERLVAEALLALEDDNSQLRRALEDAKIRIGFLEGQLHALSEAQATGRRRVVKAALSFVGAILFAASTGIAEGIPAAVTDSGTSPSELAAECIRIQDLLDEADS